MRIEEYAFGSITVGGKSYTSDVIIYPDRIEAPWWRKEGHLLQGDDLKEALTSSPEAIIIGTGAYGHMHVREKTISELRSKGIEVHVAKTAEAVKLFNEISRGKKTVACLHLTC